MESAYSDGPKIFATGGHTAKFPNELNEFFGRMYGLRGTLLIAAKGLSRHLSKAANGLLIRENLPAAMTVR